MNTTVFSPRSALFAKVLEYFSGRPSRRVRDDKVRRRWVNMVSKFGTREVLLFENNNIYADECSPNRVVHNARP